MTRKKPGDIKGRYGPGVTTGVFKRQPTNGRPCRVFYSRINVGEGYGDEEIGEIRTAGDYHGKEDVGDEGLAVDCERESPEIEEEWFL